MTLSSRPPTCPTCNGYLRAHCSSKQCDLWLCRPCETIQTADAHLIRVLKEPS